MTTKDLETLLQATDESQTLDFKASCEWKVKSFAKDFLAMANVLEGGTIVIGVREDKQGYIREGVKPEHRTTYNRETMRDELSIYTDPYVEFTVEFIFDNQGLEFIVITIEPFQDVPVICKKDSNDLREGGIYYRCRHKRYQSALVSNSFDMRDILDRAVIKMAQRAKKIGYTAPETAQEMLNKELGDL